MFLNKPKKKSVNLSLPSLLTDIKKTVPNPKRSKPACQFWGSSTTPSTAKKPPVMNLASGEDFESEFFFVFSPPHSFQALPIQTHSVS
jgi:hypothetical protein